MDVSEVRWRLLLLAVEDPLGLHEALWEFGHGTESGPRPGAPPADVVRPVLADLVREGLIELHRFGASIDERRQLTPDEAAAVLTHDESWNLAPELLMQVGFLTTDVGDRALREGRTSVLVVGSEASGD